MTSHTPELHESVKQALETTGTQTPEGRAFILDWVARNQKRLAAGLGTTALMLPFLAEAQAVGPMVNVLDVAGVRSVALNADGSAQLVLANGQQVQIAASAVQVGANGAVLVTQAAAQMLAEVVASVAAAGGGAVAGVAAGGFGGGAAAAGIGLGVAAAGAAAGGGGGGNGQAPEQLLRLNIESFSAPQSLSQIFGSAAADLLQTDVVTVTLGTGSAMQTLVAVYNTSAAVWQIDTITGNVLETLLQGRQPLSFTATRTPAEGPETEITGSVNAVVDTIAPEIAITAVAGGDAVLNAAERADALVVSGTSTAENGQVVTVQVLDGSTVIATGTATVTNGTWSARIGAGALQDAANYTVQATVSDAAGNPAASPASGSVATDFTATISIDTVPPLTTAATFFDLVLTGTSTGVEQGSPVFIDFAGTLYAATIDSSGNWTTSEPHIPQSELARLRDAGTSPIPLSVTVTDAAGNVATALAPITPSYSTPSLTITTPSEAVVLNGTTVGDPLVISGQTVPGASVVVQIGSSSLPAVTADSAGTWTATATTLPSDGSYTITASATLNGLPVASPATLGLVIDTIPPVVTITDVGVGADGVLNEAERAAGFTISGTVSDAGTTDLTTLQMTVELHTTSLPDPVSLSATVAADGTWTATVPAGISLPSDAGIQIRAFATDVAGNSEPPAIASFSTDFAATISIDTLPELNTAATFFNLVISGTTTDVGAGHQVNVGFMGANYDGGLTDSAGAWSAIIPQTVLAALRDQGTTTIPISATVTDAAGNRATVTAELTPSYATPSLTITTPGTVVVLNATTVGDPLVISGQTVPGASVVVTIFGTSLDAVVADSAGNWTATATAINLPGDGSYTITASAMLNGIPVSGPATLGLVLDATPPVVVITDSGTSGDWAYNEAERAAGFTISGTVSDMGTPNLSTVQVQVDFLIRGALGAPVHTVTATVAANGTWQAVIPPNSSFLQHNTEYDLRARAVDGAGNTGQTLFENIRADFVATATIDPFTITTVNTITGLTVTGTTTGVEQTRTVTLSLGGRTYTAEVEMFGTWSIQIPASDIAALGDDTAVNATVSVSDSAGNPATATASTTTNFSVPPLTITSPVADSFINAADSNENPNFLVTGVAIPGQTVTLVTPSVSGGRSAISDSTTGAWSFSIPRGDLVFTDGPREISVSFTFEGQPFQTSITVNVDLSAPNLTLQSQVTEDGLVVSGTAPADVDDVTLTIAGTEYQISVTNGAWSITIAGANLPAPDSFGNANVMVSGTDRAGNEASPQSITLQAPMVDFGSNTSVSVGADAFVNGFSISGGTFNMAAGSIVTVTSTDNPATFSATATVQNDGSWTATFPASQVQAAADTANLQLSATVTGTSYPVTRSASGFTASVNIPVSLSVDPIGTDGALILSETGDITLSGRTSGVQQGQTVTITTGGTQVGTAIVGADGRWTTTITRPEIDPGEAIDYSFSVSNAANTKTATATGDLVGYEAAQLMLIGATPVTVLGNQALEFSLFLDPRTVLNASDLRPEGYIFGFTEVVSFQPSALTYSAFPAPQYAAGLTGTTTTDNAASGEITLASIGFLSPTDPNSGQPIDLYSVQLVRFQFTDADGAPQPVILTVAPGQLGGGHEFIYGSNDDDALTARVMDSVIRGRGGDDTINVSAAGVNTIVFEPDPAANGVDEIIGFTVGGALADRIAFAFSNNFPAGALRGAGTMFELRAAEATGPLGADVGLVVFTTEVGDANAGAVLQAMGLQAGDVIYVLSADEDGASLVQITFNDPANFNPVTDIRDIASFSDLTAADLAQFTSANILGFSEYL